MIDTFADMNAFLRLAIIGLAFLGLPGVAGAQTGEATADVTVEVAQPLAFTINTDLDFGHLKAKKKEGGTVTITPSGDRSADGGVLLGVKKGEPDTFGPATFTISGQSDADYSFVLPTSATAEAELDTRELEVIDLTSFTENVSGVDTGKLIDGFDRVFVGGTLVVTAGTKPGVFVAVITLIINY